MKTSQKISCLKNTSVNIKYQIKISFFSLQKSLVITCRYLITVVIDKLRFIYVLTPCSTFLHETLTSSTLLNEILIFYGIRHSITLLTSARHLSILRASSIQTFYLLPRFYLSLTLSHLQQFQVHRPYNAHCIHLQQHAKISVHFNIIACFIHFVSLLTSSGPTNKFKWITYSILLFFSLMFSTKINQQ